jgi:hypothetical protein
MRQTSNARIAQAHMVLARDRVYIEPRGETKDRDTAPVECCSYTARIRILSHLHLALQKPKARIPPVRSYTASVECCSGRASL